MLNFLGIGAQKSGTTWLYDKLSQHPAVSFPAGKEVHFWDAQRSQGVQWYRALFDVPDGRLHGDITPAYGFLPQSVIAEVFAEFPDVRLIYLVRNPIERAWSSAKMAVKRAEMLVSEASDQWFIDHFRSAGSLARGDYEGCLKNWYAVYPEDNLLVLRFDELVDQPLHLLGKCCRHLGIDNIYTSGAVSLHDRVFAGEPDAVRPSLLPILHEIYDSKIHSFAQYLDEDLSAWL